MNKKIDYSLLRFKMDETLTQAGISDRMLSILVQRLVEDVKKSEV